MNTLITHNEAKILGRPIGDIKVEKLMSYIAEVEQTQIKPVLGDTLFLALHVDDREPDDVYDMLLSGGVYKDCKGTDRYFSGLKVTIAYFVYVKTLMSGDIESTRYGFVLKEDQYSQHISTAARSAAYNEAMEVAQAYLRECLEFCLTKQLIVRGEQRKSAAAGGCIIRKIG